MRKMLITGSTFPRWEGDTEPRFILDYAKAMSQYYDVTVLVPACPNAADEEVLEGVKVKRYHYFPIHKLETLCYPGAIVPRIKEKKSRILLVPFLMLSLFFNSRKYSKQCDVVHAHWIIPQGIVQSYIKKPYIVTGHGGDVTSLNKSFMKRLKKRCLKKAIGVTAVSDALKDVEVELCPGINPEVISMGCDTSSFSPEHRVDNFFNQGDKKVILFVGRLAEKKGVTYLIDAMKDVEGAKLVIVGKGNLESSLKEQAAPYGDKIEFLGPKTHDELQTIFASADIFAAPSITAQDGDKEGFGLVIIEAMASGLPVVASRSGGIVDIITDGENGLLSDEKDSKKIAQNINILLNDESKRLYIKENSINTAAQYDYGVIASKYRDLIEKML